MMQLRLYTTLGCHLCSALEAWLDQLANESVTLDRIEISADEVLMQRYGVRIPVLADAQGDELDRGFEPQRLAHWLAERGWLDDAAWQRLSEDPDEKKQATDERAGAFLRHGRRYLG